MGQSTSVGIASVTNDQVAWSKLKAIQALTTFITCQLKVE